MNLASGNAGDGGNAGMSLPCSLSRSAADAFFLAVDCVQDPGMPREVEEPSKSRPPRTARRSSSRREEDRLTLERQEMLMVEACTSFLSSPSSRTICCYCRC